MAGHPPCLPNTIRCYKRITHIDLFLDWVRPIFRHPGYTLTMYSRGARYTNDSIAVRSTSKMNPFIDWIQFPVSKFSNFYLHWPCPTPDFVKPNEPCGHNRFAIYTSYNLYKRSNYDMGKCYILASDSYLQAGSKTIRVVKDMDLDAAIELMC